MNEEALIPIFMFMSMAFVFWTFISTRNKERMAMIERGIMPSEFEAEKTVRERNPLGNLRIGLLAFFVGLGVFSAIQLHEIYNWSEGFIPAFVLMFGGLSLIIFYVIATLSGKRG